MGKDDVTKTRQNYFTDLYNVGTEKNITVIVWFWVWYKGQFLGTHPVSMIEVEEKVKRLNNCKPASKRIWIQER